MGSGATLIPDPELSSQQKAVQKKVWEQFCTESQWRKKQLEIARRTFRDGESFLRFLYESVLRFHFLEPDWIDSDNPDITHGIETDSADASRDISYRMMHPHTQAEEIIDPAEIQHIKINVDENNNRGRDRLPHDHSCSSIRHEPAGVYREHGRLQQ